MNVPVKISAHAEKSPGSKTWSVNIMVLAEDIGSFTDVALLSGYVTGSLAARGIKVVSVQHNFDDLYEGGER